MKNVVLVFKGNQAVALNNNGVSIKKTSESSFLANLEAIKDVLNEVPVSNDGNIANEVTAIYVPDFIQGLVSGTALDYIRTGKTKSGSVLSAKEVEGFKDVYKMLADRILNVKINLAKYIPKANTELITLRTNAYNTLTNYVASSVNVNSNNGAINTQQLLDPDKALREALDKQIIEAITCGDMVKMSQLKTVRDTLKEPFLVQGVSSVSNSSAINNNSIPTPNFDVVSNNNTSMVNPSADQSNEAVNPVVNNNKEPIENQMAETQNTAIIVPNTAIINNNEIAISADNNVATVNGDNINLTSIDDVNWDLI